MIISKLLIRASTLLSLMCFASVLQAVVSLPVIEADMPKALFAREAKISPQEYPIAQRLKPLLKKQDHIGALAIVQSHAEPKSAALWLLQGQLLMQLQRWQDALLSLDRALESMPDLLRAHVAKSTVLQNLDRPGEARVSLSKAISLGATEANNFALLGYLNMLNRDPHAAVAAYQQALMLEPDNSAIRQGLLFVMVNSHQFDAASNLLKGMLEASPYQASLWLQRANLAFQAKQDELALSSIEVALRLGADSSTARELAMQLHLKQGSYPRAAQLAEGLLADNKLTFDSLDKLLVWLTREAKWTLVAHLIEASDNQTIAKKPSHTSRIWFHKAALYAARQQPQLAQQAWQKAVEQDPTNADALLAIAHSAAKEGRFAQAELYFRRAEKVPFATLQAQLGRAQLYIDQLDYQAALTLLQQVLVAHPHRQDLKSNIDALGGLVSQQQTS